MNIDVLGSRPAGYAYLLEIMGLTGMPHWHTSFVSSSGTHRSKVQDGTTEDIYPIRYWPGEKVGDHLEFALKYDGVNLGLLARIFEKVSLEDLTGYIKSKPTGKYARRIWFFYEFLTGKQLPVNDLTSGNYVDALETKNYYTVQNGEKSSRHRIEKQPSWSRIVLPCRTTNRKACQTGFIRPAQKGVRISSPNIHRNCLRRALSYLYNRETKSSFEIEHIKTQRFPRTEKFITSLELAEKEDFCEKKRLIRASKPYRRSAFQKQ